MTNETAKGGAAMTEPVVIGDALLFNADCRDVLLELETVDSIITDPVWPNCKVEMAGFNRPEDLFIDMAVLAPRLAKRLVVQLGCDTDPRFLKRVPLELPFLRTCWLEYACPTYKGRLLHTGDVAYAFGEWPAPARGRMVIPGRCISSRADNYSSVLDAFRGKEKAPRDLPHPCARRLQHVSWLVNWFGEDSVLDPFMGSGTTGVAAMRLGKKFIGVEIDPQFFEVACRRLELEFQQTKLFGRTA